MSNTQYEGPDCPEAVECRGDFWIMAAEAVTKAGGRPTLAEEYADRPLREFVDVVAQNGLRLVFLPDAHISERRQGE